MAGEIVKSHEKWAEKGLLGVWGEAHAAVKVTGDTLDQGQRHPTCTL